jgi:hypothetical protein
VRERLQAAGIARRTPSSVAGPPSSSGPWAARRSRLRSRGSSCGGGRCATRRCLPGWGERPGRGPLQRSFKPRQPDSEVASDGSHVHSLSVGRWARCPAFSCGPVAPRTQHPTRPGDRARETVLGRSRRNHTPASVSLTTPETTALDETRVCSRSPAHYRFRSGRRASAWASAHRTVASDEQQAYVPRPSWPPLPDGKQQCHRRDRVLCKRARTMLQLRSGVSPMSGPAGVPREFPNSRCEPDLPGAIAFRFGSS